MNAFAVSAVYKLRTRTISPYVSAAYPNAISAIAQYSALTADAEDVPVRTDDTDVPPYVSLVLSNTDEENIPLISLTCSRSVLLIC